MNDTTHDDCVVLAAFADEDNGDMMIELLFDYDLAERIHVLPVQTYFRANQELQTEQEHLMIIKTKRSQVTEVEETIVENHTYAKPQVICLPGGALA